MTGTANGSPGSGPLRTRDGTEMDSARAVPYAYRHTYAQRHADAGVPIDVLAELLDHRRCRGPIDVLAELLDHRNLNVTRGYYRVGEDRRREAVDKVTALSFDRHGNRDLARRRARCWNPRTPVTRSGRSPSRTAAAQSHPTCRRAEAPARSGSAAPAATTSAPTSPTSLISPPTSTTCCAPGNAAPAAAINGVDTGFDRANAAPTQEEITRIRRLIGRIKGDMAQLPDSGRAEINKAVTVIRKHRAVCLGMPPVRAIPPAPARGALA